MVKQKISSIIGTVIITATLSGCGALKSIWGEKAPPRKTVTVESEAMPPVTDIFSDDESIAQKTYDRYAKMVLESFDKIKGQRENFLSLAELQSLGRAGLAKLSEKEENNVARIRSGLTLLGFKNGISRDQVITLLNWVKQNRKTGKVFYDLLIRENSLTKLTSTNLIQLVQFSGSLIALGGDDALEDSEVAEMIEPWIPENYLHAKRSLVSGIQLVNSVFGSLCGDRADILWQKDENGKDTNEVKQIRWNAKKNGQCLLKLMDHFASTAPVFDLMFDRLNPLTESGKLAAANATLVDKVESWLKDHKHPRFKTKVIDTFASPANLDIPKPTAFFDLTAWLPTLNKDSTREEFSPSFFIDLAHVVQNWVDTFQEVTASTREGDNCRFSNWRKCEFTGDYFTADRLFNDEYATVIRSNNLDFIAKISFYDSMADYLIKALDDDGDGLLKDDIKDLIGIVVRLLDSNAFAQNVIARIQEKPVNDYSTEVSISKLRRQGLGELAALAADLIPDRGGGKRTILKKLTATIYDSQKYPAYTLDRLGLATFIYLFDLLSGLRSQYMHDYDFQPVQQGPLTLIKRRKIVELMPRILHDHFPRIYNECLDWGFERTCGVVFTEVLASAPKGTDTLEPSDMDMITLTSILLESMMNRCDRNHNDELSTNLFDGFDEKHCAITVSRNLANRFMRANILENDELTKIMLEVLKWVPPARWAAKVALERGSIKGIGLRAVPIISLVSRPAKLGGVMSLAAEFMDVEKVNAINAGVEGHHEDAGDELLYLDQLTEHYLPSKEWAPRTSAAARILYGPAVTGGH